MKEGSYYAAMADVEREIRNAARRCDRQGARDKASAYRYAASLIRRVLKDVEADS